MKTITGTFQKPDGSAVASGKLYLQLSQDATLVGTAQIAPTKLTFALDASGTLGAGVSVLANDELSPSGTAYTLTVRDTNDLLAYGPETVSITGVSPINLNSALISSTGVTYPTAVITAPTSAQTIAGDFALNVGGSITAKRIERTRYADGFTGTGATAVNNAVTDAGTDACLVEIPSNVNSGLWTTPTPNNVVICDYRFGNSPGIVEGGLPNEKSRIEYTFHNGADNSWEGGAPFNGSLGITVTGFADAGGNGTAGVSDTIPFSSFAKRTGGSRGIWAGNFNAAYANLNNVAYGIETDMNNVSGADDTTYKSIGHLVVAAGGKRCGIGMQLNASGTGSGWGRGINLASFNEVGVLIKSDAATRTADLYIVPAADDTTSSIILRNHADNATKLSVNSVGDLSTTGVLATTKNLSAVAPTVTAGLTLGWNYSGGSGEADLFCDKGGGSTPGFNFYDRNGGTPVLQASVNGTGITQQTSNAAQWLRGQASELLTLSTVGTTTDTAANLLPANSIIEAVVARVTTTITTATDWKLGDATQAARFTAAIATLVAGTTTVGLNHVDPTVATANLGPVQAAAAKVRVTTTGTPGAGAIRITVFYRQMVAPTS